MTLKFRRHWPLLLWLTLTIVFFTLVLGDQRIVTYTIADPVLSVADITSYTQSITPLDLTVLHNIQALLATAMTGW